MRLLLALALVVLGTQPFGLSFYPGAPGWTGADAAYSVSLGPDRLLWLFGDTFVDPIVEGRRTSARMIHNSFGITSGGSTRFFPHALSPEEKDSYYWPSDGVVWNGKLWLFMKKVRDVPGGPAGLSFDWWGDDLLEIENYQDDPPDWRVKRHDAGPLHPGIACLVWDDRLLAYGLQEGRVVLVAYGPDLAPRYLARSAPCPDFEASPAKATALFGEAASEMSVFPYRDGFLAVYTRGGLGPSVVARTASWPGGDWSEPVELYRAPEQGVLLYAGKAHAALSTPEKLILSYCRNIGALEAHIDRPDVYFPQFVEVKLR